MPEQEITIMPEKCHECETDINTVACYDKIEKSKCPANFPRAETLVFYFLNGKLPTEDDLFY